jgi:RNA polymerase sigma factor (sigma-70 family)
MMDHAKEAAPKMSLADKVQAKVDAQNREIELWKKWKSTGDQQALGELYKSLTPLLKRIGMQYQGNLPPDYIDGEVKRLTLEALKSYDPGRGAQLNTHVTNYVSQKMKRSVYPYQNPTRLAEESHIRIPTFQNVNSNLTDRLGRPPTDQELSRELGWPKKEIQRLRTGTRRDLSALPDTGSWQRKEDERMDEILELIRYELTPQEKDVLDYIFGRNGKPKLNANDIAKRMGISPGRVSQLRSSILTKMQTHFGGQKITLPGA